MPSRRHPRPCDPEIYAKGELIAVAILMRPHADSHAVERWVKAVAHTAKARLDWHYSQHVHVMHLGDDNSYRRAVEAVRAFDNSGGMHVLQIYPRGRIGILRQDR